MRKRASADEERRKRRREYHKKWYAKNKEKRIAATKRWELAHPGVRRDVSRRHYLRSVKPRMLMERYGLTVEHVERMKDAQSGACYLCGRQGGRLVVDHDHNTGRVRGVLCDACNLGIGLLGDSLESLTRAAGYLELAHG